MKSFEEFYSQLKAEVGVELNNAWSEVKETDRKNKKVAFTLCLIIDIIALIVLWNSIMNNILIILPFSLFGILFNTIIFFLVSVISKNDRKTCAT